MQNRRNIFRNKKKAHNREQDVQCLEVVKRKKTWSEVLLMSLEVWELIELEFCIFRMFLTACGIHVNTWERLPAQTMTNTLPVY